MKRLGGWWRLWISLSVLWGIGVAVQMVANWPGYAESIVISSEDGKMLPPKAQELLGFSGRRPWEFPWDKVHIFDLRYFGSGGIQVFGTLEEFKPFEKDYRRIQKLILRRNRLQLAGNAALWWLTPCLSVLALGLGFQWVVRGFKKESAV